MAKADPTTTNETVGNTSLAESIKSEDVTSGSDDYGVTPEEKSNLEKEALMRLIAQQMITSLVGDEMDDIGEDDDIALQNLQDELIAREKARRSKKKSNRKSHVKNMRSQKSVNMFSSSHSHTELLSPKEEIAIVNDDDSFAGGHLHELVEEKHRRSSSSLVSKSSASSFRSLEETRTATSQSKTRSQELSVDEIRQYVMDNIPAAVRDQIPVEAWGEIFNGESKAHSNPSNESSDNKKKPQKKAISVPLDQVAFNPDEDSDNVTVYSDVSGLTGAFPDGKFLEHKLIEDDPSTFDSCDFTQTGVTRNTNHSKESKSSSTLVAPIAPGESSSSGRKSLFEDNVPFESRGNLPYNVGWGKVDVRYYERIITDNPAVQSGPPIGIGWRYKRGVRVPVDSWEKSRGQQQRRSSELVLPRHVREAMLREVGISQKEVAEMVRSVIKVKNQRRQTVNNLGAAGVEEAVEKARRRVGRLLSLGRRKAILKK